ncbi:MAG: hypothetical protein JO366_20795 [Methylobacteriaceae bacterium]|nr:hypothetical protein [Methylobacteriaceae bacterium]MBV9222196.1 hypothetical protein [Methylobacteriaceae bacterium]MBV9247242.1 hypothetical protein [Methylobacteriaceae bacterium]
MIEIIMTVCSLAQPVTCEDKHLQFAWEGSLARCAMAAQPYIAEWIGEHPTWRAVRWRCSYPKSNKQDA